MFGYPKRVLGTSCSFTSECLWQRFASVGTQHLAPFGQPWLLGNDPRADSCFLLRVPTNPHNSADAHLKPLIATSRARTYDLDSILFLGSFNRLGLPSNGFSNNHWALSVGVTIPHWHSKQRPDSSYEGEESDQRCMNTCRQRVHDIDVTH